jgi:hypothetical protein
MPYLLYVAVKLACYVGWCWAGLRFWQPRSSNVPMAFVFGVVRLVIGVAFGIAIFIVIPAQPSDVLWKYVTIYTPVRLVEWLIIILIMGRRAPGRTVATSLLWALGGILISFVADFASPEGVAGHFCVGRCLC